MPPTFRNLTGRHLTTAQEAFNIANNVLNNATRRLGSNRDENRIFIDERMKKLLQDAFGIEPGRLLEPAMVNAVATIRRALTKIANYFKNGTFIYIWNPPPNTRGFAAYTQTNPRRPEVFLKDAFFTHNTSRERAGLLVHEYVHLHHYAAGHPGVAGETLPAVFGRSPLNIPPNHSVNNAYCYEYFVKWFADDYNIR